MDFKEVCCNIRSCLNSSKSQLSLSQLTRDYQEVLGETIPYRKLGYDSIESLLRAVPNLRISSIRGEIFIDVKPDEKTAHIANLVREQRGAKKKKRKPFRGFSRGGPPPPRRPTTIPPPRRSEYYPPRRRNSPPRSTFQSNQNQRRPSPPRRSDRNDYYLRKRDPPAYQSYRNSAPIEISSDEDNGTNSFSHNGRQKNTEDVRRKYCSQPSQYDFSDPNDDDNDDYASDLEDCDQINNQMEELQVTLGKDRQVSINKPKLRSYPSNTSNDDDIGYSSMKTGGKTSKLTHPTISSDSYYDDDEENNSSYTTTSADQNEINAVTNESPPSEVSSKGKGDTLSKPRMNMTRGPAALLAAGRAMQEPVKSTKVQSPEPKISPHPTHSFIQTYLSKNSTTHGDCNTTPAPFSISSPTHRKPFKTINTPSVPIDDKRPSSAMFPVEKSEPKSIPIMAVGSKMSDSNMFKPGPHVQPDLASQKFCAQLHEFALQHGLKPPQYKTFVKFCPKTKAASYMCKIKIGSSSSFTSCPYESNQVKDVQDYTARIALDELRKQLTNVDVKSLPVTTDENVIIKRVAEIVNPHSSGLKSDTIESKYKLLHHQILPLDWLEIVKNRSLLSVEELMGGNMAVYPIEAGVNTVLDISKLPALILPENEVWYVFITTCTSTSCIYFRIVHDDYNGLYTVMDEKMIEVYDAMREKGDLQHVDIVKESSYYALCMDGNWFRVKALSTVFEGVVRVTLIDHGDVEDVSIEELFPLDERFTSLPAQKIMASLTGLEEYSKERYVGEIVSEMTLGKAFVARVDSRNPLQLTLIDTSTNEDIEINAIIEERIKKELDPPKVPSKNNVIDVHLVSVTEDGLATVQIYSESFKLLKSFLDEASEELAANYEKYSVKSTSDLLGSKIFLTKFEFDGKWYRGIVHKVISEEHIEVLFVDFGNVEVVTLKDIADVDQFTQALSIMPNQAVQVRLVKSNDELFTENVIQFLMDLSAPKESSESPLFLLKTVKEGAIPDVYLFYRMPDTNQLLNINDIIASYFPEFRCANQASVELSTVKCLSNMIRVESNVVNRPMEVIPKPKPKETLERIFSVPNYNVPRDDHFGVLVTMVSSPFNFIVQPEANIAELNDLKSAMNDLYGNEVPYVDVSQIKENETYAVKNKDSQWYRGHVVKLMPAYNSISVKLVDFGEIITVPYTDIAQLLPCFRILPKQAIRAELAGVTPTHSDWNVQDSLRFKELVSGKLLISIVLDIKEDGQISILLFDPSTKPIIDVSAVLVQEGRAKDITKE